MAQTNIQSFADGWEPASTEDITFDGYRVDTIDDKTASKFIHKHHYSGSCGFPMNAFSLSYRPTGELMGVCAFHNPISERVRNAIFGPGVCECDISIGASCNKDECGGACDHHYSDHVTELHRLATLDKCPKNTESWFISRALSALKERKPKYRAVVSFADQTEGHVGTIYQASNAIYYGASAKATFYRDPDGNLRPPRTAGKNVTKEFAERNGWEPEKRDSKHRYLFLLPDDEYDKDDLRDMLKIESKPYPEKC